MTDTQPRKSAHERLAAQRVAAAQARIAAAQRRRRLIVVGSAVGSVVLVVVALVIVKVATGAGSPKSGTTATSASGSVVTQVGSVPAAVFDAVGVGQVAALPKKLHGAPALTSGGKPEVLYIGADYCPFCAAERWAVVAALDRFGTFRDLGQTTSSASDVYPSTPTFSFHGSGYSSAYLVFVGKETRSNEVQGGQYAPLDTLTADEQRIMSSYDVPPYTSTSGSIPFLDIGGRYVIPGASYNPAVLQGKSFAQIAAALSDPGSAIAKAVDGTANVITAAVCEITGGQPSSVCNSAGVTAAARSLGNGG
jgi:hypothetical protein